MTRRPMVVPGTTSVGGAVDSGAGEQATHQRVEIARLGQALGRAQVAAGARRTLIELLVEGTHLVDVSIECRVIESSEVHR